MYVCTCACVLDLDYFSLTQFQLGSNCNHKTEDCSQTFAYVSGSDGPDYLGHLGHFLSRSGGSVDKNKLSRLQNIIKYSMITQNGA